MYQEIILKNKNISCLWQATASGKIIVPDGSADLIFLFRDNKLTSSYVIGASTSSFKSNKNDNSKYIGMRIRPGMIRNFLQIDANDLTDKIVSISDLPGERWIRLRDEFGEEFDCNRQLRVLETFGSVPQQVEDIRLSLFQELFFQPPAAGVNELADQLGMTRQHLRRFFLQHSGLSPKQFMSIGRFYRAYRAFGNCPAGEGSEEYFDQSHIIRDFKKWSGMTPYQLWAAQHV